MKKLLFVMCLCVLLSGCEQIFEVLGLDPTGFSYSVSTDSSTYVIGSTVTITCSITNESSHSVTQSYSGYISSLFYCEAWKDNQKVWNTQENYPDVYMETIFDSKEKKDYTHYWVNVSTSGSYEIRFEKAVANIEIQ